MALKSLRDSLLEYAVLNVEQLFTHGDWKAFITGENKGDDVRNLPPGLFDEILWKSNEMLWEIPEQCLIPCVFNRDKVKCRNVSYFTRKRHLNVESLERIIQVGPPIISLDIRTRIREKHSDAVKMFLDKLANSLKSLKLKVRGEQFIKHQNTLETRPVMRLKRLVMEDYSSFSQLNLDPLALNVLELKNIKYERELLARIEEFQNLTYLHLEIYCSNVYCQEDTKEEKEAYGDTLQTVLKLKKLRFLGLNLYSLSNTFTTEDLNIMISNLVSLEELELHELTMTSSKLVQPPKKLKLLSIFELHSNGFSQNRLNLLARKVLIPEISEDFLHCAEISRSTHRMSFLDKIYSDVSEDIYWAEDKNVRLKRLEGLTLELLRDGYEKQFSVCGTLNLNILSKDFLSKLARVKFGSYELMNNVYRKFVRFLEDKFKASLRRRDSLFRKNILSKKGRRWKEIVYNSDGSFDGNRGDDSDDSDDY